ncbi:hypothetical protein KUCAC02_027512 [Chaenocephalus aceratus]|uniref:Uncharacterized protein n=1 Tax=Chaenocephalus aceratus TaxID=36190 RepID=A0ACB9W4P8_CHAAC|nr:hypothetical protein KUCAC02_027512 [Chaenocephalus aceratus]
MSAIKDLRRDIQRQLHQLINFNESDVLSIDDEAEEELPGDDATDVELYDFIVDFLKSNQLASQEDQGMSRLLVFNDLITELQQLSEAVEEHLYKVQPEKGSKTLLLPVNELPLDEVSPAQHRKEEPRLEKKTQTHIAEVDEDDSDSSDDEYTVQPVPCYREETYAQEENPPPIQEGAAENVAVEEEPQDRHMEGMVADEEGHQVEAETVRRSQRTAY